MKFDTGTKSPKITNSTSMNFSSQIFFALLRIYTEHWNLTLLRFTTEWTWNVDTVWAEFYILFVCYYSHNQFNFKVLSPQASSVQFKLRRKHTKYERWQKAYRYFIELLSHFWTQSATIVCVYLFFFSSLLSNK